VDRSRKFALAVLGISLLAPLLVASAAAQAAPKPAVVLSGSVGRLPGRSALVVVQVGLPYGANNPRHIPAGFHYPAVAEQTITSRTFSIGVPDSATLQRARKLGHGVVEFNILIFSGARFTSEMYPVALTQAAANGNRQALGQAQSRSVTLSRFRAFGPDPASMRRALPVIRRRSPGVPAVCAVEAWGNPVEDLTRIGEVHVGSASGLSMRWDYNNTSDTTLSVGISTSGATGPWSLNGTYTTSNSMGTSGGFTAGNATRVYSDGDMWYQRYKWLAMCSYFTT
jgi:hypothetical protein